MVEIRPVLSSDVHMFWPEVAPLLQKAIDRGQGEIDLDICFEELINQERSLWIVTQNGSIIAAITTRIEEYKTGKRHAIIDLAGGNGFQKWSMFTDYISPFYFMMGCDMLIIAGRLGWLRLHTDKEFKPLYHVIGKKLG